MDRGYFDSRFVEDLKRAKSWAYLCEYFQRFVPREATVLELGAGYCYFINQIDAERKIAVDLFPDLERYASADVEAHLADATKLDFIDKESVDIIFASNFLEHLEWGQLHSLMNEMTRVLSPNGQIILMQPNYRLSYRSYFDDYTHRTIFTDRTLLDWFESHHFICEFSKPRFLPLTVKSRLGAFSRAIPLYLRSPWKPFAGQMCFVFRNSQK